jgi:hypothetical protein
VLPIRMPRRQYHFAVCLVADGVTIQVARYPNQEWAASLAAQLAQWLAVPLAGGANAQ